MDQLTNHNELPPVTYSEGIMSILEKYSDESEPPKDGVRSHIEEFAENGMPEEFLSNLLNTVGYKIVEEGNFTIIGDYYKQSYENGFPSDWDNIKKFADKIAEQKNMHTAYYLGDAFIKGIKIHQNETEKIDQFYKIIRQIGIAASMISRKIATIIKNDCGAWPTDADVEEKKQTMYSSFSEILENQASIKNIAQTEEVASGLISLYNAYLNGEPQSFWKESLPSFRILKYCFDFSIHTAHRLGNVDRIRDYDMNAINELPDETLERSIIYCILYAGGNDPLVDFLDKEGVPLKKGIF